MRQQVKPPPPDAGPDSPTQLGWGRLKSAIVMTAKEFQRDDLTVWAGALTYWGVLSLFPGMLTLMAILGLLDASLVQALLDNVVPIIPPAARDIVISAIDTVQQGNRTAGFAAIFGGLVGFWSASGYVAGFMKASNAIYDVPEGRPMWKTVPIRLGVTAATGILLVASILIVVVSGGLAERVGDVFGIADQSVWIWNVVKWPVLLVLVALMFAILYWASPNAHQGGFRWVTPGGALAVLLWLAVSVGFAIYVANFASYNKTYGALGGVIVFLVWLWLSNLAILFGAEFNAELERQRAIAAGHPPDQEPYMQVRDDSKVAKPTEEEDI